MNKRWYRGMTVVGAFVTGIFVFSLVGVFLSFNIEIKTPHIAWIPPILFIGLTMLCKATKLRFSLVWYFFAVGLFAFEISVLESYFKLPNLRQVMLTNYMAYVMYLVVMFFFPSLIVPKRWWMRPNPYLWMLAVEAAALVLSSQLFPSLHLDYVPVTKLSILDGIGMLSFCMIFVYETLDEYAYTDNSADSAVDYLIQVIGGHGSLIKYAFTFFIKDKRKHVIIIDRAVSDTDDKRGWSITVRIDNQVCKFRIILGEGYKSGIYEADLDFPPTDDAISMARRHIAVQLDSLGIVQR